MQYFYILTLTSLKCDLKIRNVIHTYNLLLRFGKTLMVDLVEEKTINMHSKEK